jgi:ribosomal protein S21
MAVSVTTSTVNPFNAILELRRKITREGSITKYRMSKFHEPNTAKRIRKAQESRRRRRKNQRKDY